MPASLESSCLNESQPVTCNLQPGICHREEHRAELAHNTGAGEQSALWVAQVPHLSVVTLVVLSLFSLSPEAFKQY
jgi:hypothetical protein